MHNNVSILEKFMKEISDNVPTDDRIVLNTSKIEIGTRTCIPNNFVRKEIVLSWIESEEENKNEH